MSKTTRHIINSISAVLLIGGLAGAFFLGSSFRAPLTCTGLSVKILDSAVNKFVSRADIEKYLNKEYGDYIGKAQTALICAKWKK